MYQKNNNNARELKIYLIFPPINNRPLTVTYPELKEVEEFVKLTPKELLFVWYYTIPYSGYPIKDRVKLSINDAYGDDISDNEKNKLIYDNWNSDLRSAAAKMETYNLSARMKSKAISEQIFANLRKIVNLDISGLIDEQKWEDIKKYTAICGDITDQLPDMIRKIEDGYGVGEVAVTYRGEGNFMGSYYAKVDDEK